MEKHSGATVKVYLQDISDNRLVKQLVKMEAELDDVVTREYYPERIIVLGERCKKIRQEINRRRLDLEKTRRDFVIEWLNKIDLDDIEPLNQDEQ